MLQNTLYKAHLLDLLEYGINKATIKDNEVYGNDGLVYYRKYSRKDVFKIMNFDKDQNPQNVGGYIIQEVDGRKKCPVFVTYEKAEDISSSTKYKDYFINNTRFNWMSKNKRYLNRYDAGKYVTHAPNTPIDEWIALSKELEPYAEKFVENKYYILPLNVSKQKYPTYRALWDMIDNSSTLKEVFISAFPWCSSAVCIDG